MKRRGFLTGLASLVVPVPPSVTTATVSRRIPGGISFSAQLSPLPTSADMPFIASLLRQRLRIMGTPNEAILAAALRDVMVTGTIAI